MLRPYSSSDLRAKISRFIHSVRFRLSLWYLAVLALALVIFGVTIYSVEERSLSGAIDAELGAFAEPVSKFVYTQNGQFRLPPQFEVAIQQIPGLNISDPTLAQLANFPGVKSLLSGQFFIMLVDSQGNVTQQLGTLSPGDVNLLKTQAIQAQTKTEATNTSLELEGKPSARLNQQNNTYRIEFYAVREASSGKVNGTLVLGLGWEGAATLQNLLWTLVLAGLATLVLTAGGGYWLASRAIRPVSRITRLARSITETDLSRRINLKNQNEVGELAATFDGMLERLENAFERQRQFTADASHELRTPLTIINLEVNRVAKDHRTVEDYERAFSIIQTENEYMTRLVTDLLSLARSDSGQVVFKPERLDLSDLALEVVERLAPLARQNQIELVTGDLPEIEINGDHLYLIRMLANLVENGIKYTAGKGNMVEIETGISGTDESSPEKGQWAWIKVKDNGPGIASQHLPYLFDRFYQVDKARGTRPSEPISGQPKDNLQGSGLGLSIVRWVAELHRGRVRVESEGGKGTTFEIDLPLAK